MAFLGKLKPPLLSAFGPSTGRAWLAVVLLLSATQGLRAQQIPREDQLKAVFLFNFAQFVEWPTNSFAATNSPLVIGVYGRNPFGSALLEIVQGEYVRGHPLHFRQFEYPSQTLDAHILFISRAEEAEWGSVLRALGTRPILTVSDMENFARRGGMIHFFTEENRVRLRINHSTARESGLTLSSKLLRVADVIDSD